MANKTFQVHPYHADLIQKLAARIVSDNQQQLPFLHNIVVLLPNYQTTFRLQESIAALATHYGFETLIGLQIFTLKDFIHSTTLSQFHNIHPITRELLLLEALKENSALFGEHNVLTTTYALLELFDKLTRFQIEIPQNYESFEQQLQHAYQCSHEKLDSLSNEAQIIHQLWQAWHAQLESLDLVDPATNYQLKLGENLQQFDDNHYYVAGYYDLLPSEINWLKQNIEADKVTMLFQGEYSTTQQQPSATIQQLVDQLQVSPEIISHSTKPADFYNAVFDTAQINIKQRAAHLNSAHKQSPVENQISIFCANNFEEEALTCATQVKAWLAEGKTKLAILIEDRRLARRCRAILEHSGVGLVDLAGWALSTSAAASLVENWLQCIEENFYYIPLIDILKSPFAFNEANLFNQSIYRFEQDIIQRETVLRDINRYKAAINSREHRLNSFYSNTSTQIKEMLSLVETAATPLLEMHNKNSASVLEYLDALMQSLNSLSAIQKFETDDAGQQIIHLVDDLKNAAKTSTIKMQWIEFRHWFGLKLEEHTFIPENRFAHKVELLHLSQTVLGRYEAIVIGNMTQEHYPGAGKSSPFFNQSVRAELGLPTQSKQTHIRFYHFRRVLESSSNILLTYNRGEDDTPASPWVTLISRFHELSFGNSLENRQLRQLLEAVKNTKTQPDKSHNGTNKLPTINADLTPEKISASSHQQLINCPYAFFAGSVLKLRAPEEIKEKLSKNDYGSRVHLCLQAFHVGDIKNIPGPFDKALIVENRLEAINFLENISGKVFHNDLEDNFQHRGWLKRWHTLIPSYIDWQIARSKIWKFHSGEIASETPLANITLKGRIDRVDIGNNNFAIMDYKTGTTPSKVNIETGEAVQLPHYALSFNKEIEQIEYLQFEAGNKPLAEKCTLANEELDAILENTKIRTETIFNEIHSGAELPAWGNEQVCNYCQYAGMCRHYL